MSIDSIVQSKRLDLIEQLKTLVQHKHWLAVYSFLCDLRNNGDLFLVFPVLKDLDCSETLSGVNHKNVMDHTFEVMRNLKDLLTKEERFLDHNTDYDSFNALMLGALLHDIGKVKTKKFDHEKKAWTYHAHEEIGYKMAKSIVDELGMWENDRDVILTVIRYHQLPGQLEDIGDKGLRRFCLKIGKYLPEIMLIAKADTTSNNQMKVLKNRQKVDDLHEKIKDFLVREEVRLTKIDISNAEVLEATGVANILIAAGIKEMVKELVLINLLPNSKEEITNYLKGKFKNE